jgi:hypothetical protein
LGNELWHDLLGKKIEGCRKHKESKHLVLQSLLGVWRFKKGKSDKKTL